jgi:tetratricopeptide (TPR) repeat protein
MSEGPADGQDSRREQEPARHAPETAAGSRAAEPGHDSVRPRSRGDDPPSGATVGASSADTYDLYRRGLDLLGRGSAAAAAQLLERAAAAEPNSRSVLEALARAQFDARRYAAAAGNFRRIVEASPSDDYAQFGLGLALARTGDPRGAAEHLALAAAMRPDLRHYTDALRGVRATLRARAGERAEGPEAGMGRRVVPRRDREAEDEGDNPDDSARMSGDG